MVVYWHYIVDPLRIEGSIYFFYIKYAGALTWCGVDLFFVLSGFLIGGILLDNKNNKNYFKTFYIRRICRIFPLFFLWLSLFYILTSYLPVENNRVFYEPYPLWSYALFIQNFFLGETSFGSSWLAITWSLAIEEQFYLLLPPVIYFLNPRYVAPLLVVLILSGPAARLMTEGLGSFVYTYCRTDSLMTGVFIAWLIRKNGVISVIEANRKFLWCLISGFILLFIYLTYLLTSPGDVINHFIFAILFGLIILATITTQNSFYSSILKNKSLLWLGSRSYAIYLFHQAVNGLWYGAFGINESEMTNFEELPIVICSIITVIFLAEISYRFYERPLIKFSHRFRYE